MIARNKPTFSLFTHDCAPLHSLNTLNTVEGHRHFTLQRNQIINKKKKKGEEKFLSGIITETSDALHDVYIRQFLFVRWNWSAPDYLTVKFTLRSRCLTILSLLFFVRSDKFAHRKRLIKVIIKYVHNVGIIRSRSFLIEILLTRSTNWTSL